LLWAYLSAANWLKNKAIQDKDRRHAPRAGAGKTCYFVQYAGRRLFATLGAGARSGRATGKVGAGGTVTRRSAAHEREEAHMQQTATGDRPARHARAAFRDGARPARGGAAP
jgi:hypothetical protein